MPKSWCTIAFLLAFLITTVCLQWFQFSVYPRAVWMVLGFLVLVLSFLLVLGEINERLRLSFVPLLLCILFGSIFSFVRVSQTTHIQTPQSIEAYAEDRAVTVQGIIVAEPDRRPLQTKYTVASYWLQTASGVVVSVRGKVLATDYAAWPSHAYGDEVTIRGVLERPTQIEDFHYDRYLSRYGIHSVMYRAEVDTLSAGHGRLLFSFLFDLKSRFEAQINRLYAEPHASLMAGLLTGSRRGIPEHLLKNFQTTGLTHIIAISGYNIAIVIAVMSSVLFFVPLKYRLVPSLIAIAFFTLFVGASPSVVRAAIMGALALFALHVGREQHAMIAVLFTAFLMVFWNPKILWYDAGFQLSFLAVLGLTYVAPHLERWMQWIPKVLAIRESLQMTIAAQIAAVPLIVVLFGQFSIVAPLANVLVAPLIPLAMLFGFVGTVMSFLWFPLGQAFAYIGWGALELIVVIAERLSAVPYASIDTGQMGSRIVWAYYAGLMTFLLWRGFRGRAASS